MNVGEVIPWPDLRENVTHKEGKAIIQVASLFNQLLQHFPRTEFGALVKENKCGAMCQGLWLLDTIGRNAVLPTGPRRFAARDL
jgi:hypothetical protein